MLSGGSPLPNAAQIDGLAFRGNTLYGLRSDFQTGDIAHLVIIDPTTRQVTDVGSLGVAVGATSGLAYHAGRDRFYFGGEGNPNLYEVDPGTLSVYVEGSHGQDWLSGLTLGTSRGTVFEGAHVVVAESGQSTPGVDFGYAMPVTVSGTKYLDLNADGRNTGEPLLPGWGFYLDRNYNGWFDEFWTGIASPEMIKPLPDVSTTISSLSATSVSEVLWDVNVTVGIQHTYDGDLEAVLVSPEGTRVRLFNRVGGSGHDFADTTLDDDATLSILAGTAPFAGSYRPEEPLSVLNGEDPRGIWALEITDHAGQDVGVLNGWSLTLLDRGADGGIEPRWTVRIHRPHAWRIRRA